MKLIRHGEAGAEKPGLLLDNGRMIDASGLGEDYDEQFFATGGLQRLREWMEAHQATAPRLPEGVRLGPPVARPGKLICIGLNYADHAAESGMDIPKEPVVFFKATSAIVGPNDDLIIPRGSKKTDWGVELAVVIGKRASYVQREQALEYVAGYCLHNDYSEREFQIERGGQWVKGKSCDTFAPLGPFMATRDEIPDSSNLKLWLMVNGEMRQNGHTSQFVFDVPYVISYLSQFMSLLPGDIISTGTPPGVGLGMNPPTFLKPGDVVELGIEGLGSARQLARAWQPPA
ncbi:MAG: FAA hydrolase family protein [Bacteroidetes bacterium]|nr:MAG: FAA hydrolase family protein [Bacteroidota bacterium]